jgi:hypothetical protein
METFKEWLAEQAERKSDVADRQERIKQWIESVTALFSQIETWLDEDGANTVLRTQQNVLRKREEGLGMYEVPQLNILLFDRLVEIVPAARNVGGGLGTRSNPGFRPEGRVDMTNGAEKYMLYHVGTSTGKKWVVVDDAKYTIRDLDKETFEAALQDLLS